MTVDLKLAHVSPMPLTADGRTLPFLFIIIFSLSTFSLFPQYLDCLPACLRSFESSILLCFKEVALGINYMLIGTSLTYFLEEVSYPDRLPSPTGYRRHSLIIPPSLFQFALLPGEDPPSPLPPGPSTPRRAVGNGPRIPNRNERTGQSAVGVLRSAQSPRGFACFEH